MGSRNGGGTRKDPATSRAGLGRGWIDRRHIVRAVAARSSGRSDVRRGGQLLRLSRSPIGRATGFMAYSYGTGFILQGLYFVLLGRWLGSVGYGVFAGAFALA